MIRIWTTVASFLLPTLFAAPAAAIVEVTYFNTVGTPLNTDTYANGASIFITLNSNIGSIRVVANPTSGNVGFISVGGSASAPVKLFVTSDMNVAPTPPSTTGCQDWAGMFDGSGLIRLKARLSGDLTDSIDVHSLVYMVVADEVQDYVHSEQGSFYMEAGRIASAGDITLDTDEISLVRVTTGNLLGDVRALDGSMGIVEAIAGDIGASGQPVAIEASAATSTLHIERINAAKDMYANVDCDTSTTATDGVIKTFFVGNGATPSTAGDFHGSLRLADFTEQITIVRDLYGAIEYGSTLTAGSTAAPKEIIIGRSLKSGAQVNFPASGLQGHVGINRVQSAGGTWESGATINIGTTSLTAYNYADTASSIGGGSAGLISYRLHNTSCAPVNGGTALTACATHPAVRLRHYGPLQWNSANGAPATISRRLACTNDSFTSVSATTSNFTLDDDNPSATEPQRTLVVTLPFAVGYEYKITPTSALKSFGAGSGNPAVTWDSDYTFTVKPACFADVDANGTIGTSDLLAVIAAWGACTTPPTACPADVGPLPCPDGNVGTADLLAVIGTWGPCPTCDEESEEGGGGFGMMSSAMSGAGSGSGIGEIDWDYFIDCLENGTPEQQADCLAALQELLDP